MKKMKEAFDLEKSLKKIKDAELDIELLRRENEKACRDNDFKIGELNVVIGTTEKLLEFELKKSGEDKLECKLGSVSFNVMPDKWRYQDEILMAWIISLPARLKGLFLKVVTTIKKAELKKQIMIDNDHLFFKSKFIEGPHDKTLILVNEELPEFPIKVEGIEINPQDPQFSYTIKKKK